MNIKEVQKSKISGLKLYFLKIVLIIGLIPTSIFSQNFKMQIQDTKSSSWTADNGNGTFTNPLFYEEFSDPDLIRVGDDYYMTGTTMHTMPGLPVLHSKDLVNWELLSYAVDKLDFDPKIRLEDGKESYGQGIWAPSFRYHNGTFYIFTNINGLGTQIYYSNNPRGPWKHKKMKAKLHDLSVLFDDDGKIYVVWDYDELKMAQLSEDLLEIIPGTEKVIVEHGSGAGEGSHFYKIDGKYYITNTNYDPTCYQVCLRADKPYGPYEINVMSAKESLGEAQRSRIWNTNDGPPFNITTYPENFTGCIPMHQGGIVQIQSGEWWGWSMLDYNSVGRVTALSPVTWKDGWPYFGLPGNLTRSPRTWVKPNTGFSSEPSFPFERNDDFNEPKLKNAWQWNHTPVDEKWSLAERKGYLRLHSLLSKDFWHARNSLTQRGIGPESYATTEIDVSKLKEGDIAGLALLNLPYATIGIYKEKKQYKLQFFNQQKKELLNVNINQSTIWLRAHCNFNTDLGKLSYSFDGQNFQEIGGEILMPFQLKTFQGVRYALFNFNSKRNEGGYADFNSFYVEQPYQKISKKGIPYNQIISLKSVADNSVLVNWKHFLRPVNISSNLTEGETRHFKVLDRGNGRVALQSLSSNGFVTVKGHAGIAEVRIETEDNGEASTFQWQELLNGDVMLMSLYNHRYLNIEPKAGTLCSANAKGGIPNHKSGACFNLTIIK